METITSRENARIKEVVRLISSKKQRDDAGLFVVEGARLCIDAASWAPVQQLFVTEQAVERYPQLTELCQSAKQAFWITPGVAEKISDTKATQGVFAVLAKPGEQQQLTVQPQGRYLLLSSIQDPGNLGTIIRTAEALGIDGLVLSSNCPDVYSPKVVRGTMGGILRLPIYRVPDLCQTIADLRQGDIPVYAAALSPQAVRLDQVDFSGGAAVLVGNEGSGLEPELIAASTAQILIPMAGQAESLNGAVAAAILMWELTRSRL